MGHTRLKRTTALAGAAALAAVATGCGGGGGEPASADNPVELTVTTFGTFGYDDLYGEYEELNPGVTIKATNIDRGSNARTDAFTKIAAGSGLSDVTAIEEGWLGSIMEVSDQFVDLNEHGAADIKDNWVPWKFEQGTDPEGRVIGYGTDIGPQGLCYNGKLFEEAGGFEGKMSLGYNADSDHKPWTTATCNSIRETLGVECIATPTPDFATFRQQIGDVYGYFFPVGIVDDVTHLSLKHDPSFSTEGDDVIRAVFYGFGSDGTVVLPMLS